MNDKYIDYYDIDGKKVAINMCLRDAYSDGNRQYYVKEENGEFYLQSFYDFVNYNYGDPTDTSWFSIKVPIVELIKECEIMISNTGSQMFLRDFGFVDEYPLVFDKNIV